MNNAVRLGALLVALHALPTRAALATVPSTTSAPHPAAGGLLQAGLGLLVVLALVFACAWVFKRLNLPAAGGGHRIVKVLASAAVGQRERVVVVEVGGEWLVLGVASGSVRILHTMPPGAAAPQAAPSVPGAGSGFDASLFAQKLRASLAHLKGQS